MPLVDEKIAKAPQGSKQEKALWQLKSDLNGAGDINTGSLKAAGFDYEELKQNGIFTKSVEGKNGKTRGVVDFDTTGEYAKVEEGRNLDQRLGDVKNQENNKALGDIETEENKQKALEAAKEQYRKENYGKEPPPKTFSPQVDEKSTSWMSQVIDGYKNTSFRRKMAVGASAALLVESAVNASENFAGYVSDTFSSKPKVDAPTTTGQTASEPSFISEATTAALDTAQVGMNMFTAHTGMQEMKNGTKSTALFKDAAMGVKASGGLGKFALKKLPLVGLGLGMMAAESRAESGDYVGAGLEAVSGVASMIPGVGTVASSAIDIGLIARDKMNTNNVPTYAQNAFSGTTGSATMATMKANPPQVFQSGPVSYGSIAADGTVIRNNSYGPSTAMPQNGPRNSEGMFSQYKDNVAGNYKTDSVLSTSKIAQSTNESIESMVDMLQEQYDNEMLESASSEVTPDNE